MVKVKTHIYALGKSPMPQDRVLRHGAFLTNCDRRAKIPASQGNYITRAAKFRASHRSEIQKKNQQQSHNNEILYPGTPDDHVFLKPLPDFPYAAA